MKVCNSFKLWMQFSAHTAAVIVTWTFSCLLGWAPADVFRMEKLLGLDTLDVWGIVGYYGGSLH